MEMDPFGLYHSPQTDQIARLSALLLSYEPDSEAHIFRGQLSRIKA